MGGFLLTPDKVSQFNFKVFRWWRFEVCVCFVCLLGELLQKLTFWRIKSEFGFLLCNTKKIAFTFTCIQQPFAFFMLLFVVCTLQHPETGQCVLAQNQSGGVRGFGLDSLPHCAYITYTV